MQLFDTKSHRQVNPAAAWWAAVVGVLLVAAALRLTFLERYPPGWTYDEALMGVMAGEVYRGDERPIFFRQWVGQEPLYIYASAGTMAILGGSAEVLPERLTSAAFGLLTVLFTFLLGRALFGPRVGLLAAAGIGTSFWQVMSSRNAYRSITQPFLEAVAVYLLWQALQRQGIRWFALAGAALGATLYTYLGARAFPTVFVGFGIWLVLTRGLPKRSVIPRVAVLASVAFLVAAPLIAFFLLNPGTVSARMEQVFIFQPGISHGHPWQLLADNTVKMLEGFTIKGETLWRYSLPGRPMFVGALAAAFYAGLLLLVGRVWRRDDGAAIVAIWLGAMFFPSLLSWDTGGYTLRSMGLVPAVYFLPALGLDWLWRRLTRLPIWGPRFATVIVGLILLVDGAWTARDYFVVWSTSFGASWEGGADSLAQARFIARNAQPDVEDVFAGSNFYHHPGLAQLARPVYPSLRWFDGTQDVVFSPATHRPALYVLAFASLPPNLDEIFPKSAVVSEQYFPAGIDGGAPPPLFVAYRLTAEQIQTRVEQIVADPSLHPVVGHIGDSVVPIGARMAGPVHSGDVARATLIWRVQQPLPSGEYQLVAQLLDQRWQVVSSVEGLGFPPPDWRSGDVVWSQFALPVPAETPSGLYKVQVALYNPRTGQRTPVVDGPPGIQALVLGDVRVVGTPPPPPPTVRIGAQLGSQVQLLGIDPPRFVNPRTLAVTLDWSAGSPLKQDYTVFVQLLNAKGELVAQSDGWPVNGDLPTSSWLPGEEIQDVHLLTLSPNLPPGTYRLITGLYVLSTGQRLGVASGGDFVTLDTLSLPAH